MTGHLPPEFDLDPGEWNAFTETARHSGRMLNAVGLAQIKGAGNLLDKAIGHLISGDEQRAEQLMLRAARMPYDQREAGSPGVRAATMLVYDVISDELDNSGIDDPTWLDVPIAVHDRLDPTGQAKVASIVHGFVLQKAFFTTSPAEKRRISEAFGDAPLNADLGDGPTATVEQRLEIIRSLVAASMALEDGYAAQVRRF